MGARNRPKKVPTTVLMVGEGVLAEKVWLNHLKQLFEQAEIVTTVKSGKGNTRQTLRFALDEVEEGGGFDRVLVLMDTDESWGDPNNPADLDRIGAAVKKEIKLLGTDPCLEGFLLRLLNSTKAPSPEVAGQWSQNRHPEILRRIHDRFQKRIPAGDMRPQGSLCDHHKQAIAGCLGGSLHDEGVLSRHFPRKNIESSNHPVLKNILQYLQNAPVSYSPDIIIG